MRKQEKYYEYTAKLIGSIIGLTLTLPGMLLTVHVLRYIEPSSLLWWACAYCGVFVSMFGLIMIRGCLFFNWNKKEE